MDIKHNGIVISSTSEHPPNQPVEVDALDSIGESLHAFLLILTLDPESYPDYAKRKRVLIANKERRIADADRNRRMQIANITDLYEFEIEDIEAKLVVSIP